MLVLTRRLGEEIVIGEGIRLTVVAIHGNKVRLGFAAPENVSILREELGPQAKDPRPLVSRRPALEADP